MNEFDVFQAALEIEDPAERKAFLHSTCKEDGDVVRRVESLLASHEGESLFLKRPVGEQMKGDGVSGTAPTVMLGDGSRGDENPSAPTRSGGADATDGADQPDDPIPLGFLAPPTRAGSLGRLAHYEILEVLGRGAFGTVLKALDETLQRVVAIKVLSPELANTSPARKRFSREAKASAGIRHEHVVSVYAVEETAIPPYLVMEYIPGETLQHRLDEKGPLDVVSVVRLGRQIAEGLAAAHAKDLIHRDVKPGNILLETGLADHVKITDFGLARAADDASMTQSGVIAGTPLYMAPEQALGHTLDQRADLFSFGSVLYQMVSGRPPFRAPTTLAVLKRLTEEHARPIQEIIPETPDWLCNIIAKLHAKNPDERYQSAREVADVLASCETQLREHAGVTDLSLIPQTLAPPAASWWKWVAAAVLLVPLLALAGTELTGVTHLFHGRQGTTDPIEPVKRATPIVAAGHRFGSDEWIDVIPLIDPALDRWNVPTLTGKNAWRKEEGELVVDRDAFASKLVLPLDSDWPAFECELEFTRRAGNGGLTLNLPARLGDCPVAVDAPGGGVAFGSRTKGVVLKEGSLLVTGQRATLHARVRRQQDADHVSVAFNGANVGQWTGDRNAVAFRYQENYPQDRRLSLWIHPGGNEFVFHRIRIRMLDGATAESLRPVPTAPSVAAAEPRWVQLFNGKDLTGWKSSVNSNTTWTWADGVLTANGLGDLLVTDRNDYENYHLRMAIKHKRGSSVWVRLRDADGDLYLIGIRPWPGSERLMGGGLTVYDNQNQKGLAHNADVGPPEEWHTLEVIAVGNRFQTFVNGKPAADVTDPDRTSMRGSIALSLRGRTPQEVQFKDVEIKELPATPSGTPSPAAKTPPLAVAPFDAAQAKTHQDAWAKHLGVPVEYASASGMKFRLIPPGEFTMGSSQQEIERAFQRNAKLFENPLDVTWHKNCIESEGPAHLVKVTRPFYLGTTHVTVGQFRQFVMQAKHRVTDDRWEKPGWEQTDDHPVVFVAWSDAAAYCGWFGEQEGRACRLPTEAEWEYACRAGTTTRYWFGDDEADVPRFAWLKPNSEGRTHPVGKLAANPFGLYDMLGNAWQWCEDPHDPAFYKKSPQADPFCETGTGRLIRGGSWNHDPLFGRSAFRNSTSMSPATQADADKGFRVVLSVSPISRPVPPMPVASAAGWTVLKPSEMKSEGGATLKLQEDGSIVASGENPDKDSYVLSIAALPAKIRTLRLDALTHASLPNQGPGRNGELPFVLSAIKAELVPAGNAAPPSVLKFAKASGDSSGDDAVPAFALDAADITGWSAEIGKPHFAQFELAEPLAIAPGEVLRVTLEFKHDDVQRALGCFRLSASP